MQEAVTDKAVRLTCLIGASQVGGKTTVLENTIAYFIAHDPRSIVMLYPTLESCERFSRRKLSPMLQETPALQEAFKISRAKGPHSTSTMLSKDYPGGSLFLVTAQSPATLRGCTGSVLLADEIDSYEANAEGDPIELLWKRGESYRDTVRVVASTPTIEGSSRIWRYFQESDQQYWFVPCLACGKDFRYEWKLVRWEKGHDEDAWIECPHCAAHHDDVARVAMYRRGKWSPTAPFNGTRGFHLNGLYRMWPAQKGFKSGLHQFVVEFKRSVAAGRTSLMTWTNTFLSEPFREEAERLSSSEIQKHAETYKEELPKEVLVLTAGADVQIDRIEVEVVGWGVDEESWGIEYKVIPGKPDDPATWKALDEHLLRTWKRADGTQLRVAAAGVDYGFYPDAVFKWTKPRFTRSILAVKGSPIAGSPVASSLRRSNRFKAPSFLVGTDTAKGLIFSRLKLPHPGPGYSHFPGVDCGYDESYYSGLTSEELRVTIRKGFSIREWHKVKARNEPLDCRVYAFAMLKYLNPNWAALVKGQGIRVQPLATSAMHTAEERGVVTPPTAAPVVTPPPAGSPESKGVRPPPRRFPRGFGGGWRKF